MPPTDDKHPPEDLTKPAREQEAAAHEAAAPEAAAPATAQAGAADSGALSDALHLSFTFLKVAMAIFVAVYLLQGIFYVKPGEVRVKLSFGRPVPVKGPAGPSYVIKAESGWHFRWPWEEVKVVPLNEQTLVLGTEFWYGQQRNIGEREERARTQAGLPEVTQTLNVKSDGYLVTGDVNIAHLKLRVRYTARDDEAGAIDYAFRVKNPVIDGKEESSLLRKLVVESVIETVGAWPVNDVLSKTSGERGLLEEIENRTREKLHAFEVKNSMTAGVNLVAVEFIGDPAMPQRASGAYNDAQTAQSEKDKMISEAEKAAKDIMKSAEGETARILSEAETYKNRLIAIAKADANTLAELQKAYTSSPEIASILRTWHYQRTMEQFLGQAKSSFVFHKANEGSNQQFRFTVSGGRKAARESAPGAPKKP